MDEYDMDFSGDAPNGNPDALDVCEYCGAIEQGWTDYGACRMCGEVTPDRATEPRSGEWPGTSGGDAPTASERDRMREVKR